MANCNLFGSQRGDSQGRPYISRELEARLLVSSVSTTWPSASARASREYVPAGREVGTVKGIAITLLLSGSHRKGSLRGS
ncbi:MAG: hypothetical protein ACUVRY_09380 [Thermoanaerobaculaceae bacterium]